MRPGLRLLAPAAIAALSSSLLFAAPGDSLPTLQQLLARPMSPGSIAALVTHLGDASAQARVAAALSDPRAEMRATAAHIAFVTRARLVLPSVLAAFERETDDEAAAAMVRSVATFDGPARMDRLLALAKSRGGAVREALLESLARSHPALLMRLAADEAFEAPVLATPLVLSAAQHAADRAALARAALSRGPVLWAAYLDGMHGQMLPVDPAVLTEALSSPDVRLRSATAYHVARLAWHDHGVDRGVLTTTADGAEARAVGGWEGAYRELARRALNRPARPVDWSSLLGPESVEARRARFADVNAGLLGSEREAVQTLVGMTLPGVEWYSRRVAHEHLVSRGQKTRTLASSIARLLPDLASVFGCAPPSSRFAAATMVYNPDGRPRVVRPADSGLDAACAAVAHTAFLLTIATPAQPVLPTTSDGIYLPFLREYMACVATPGEPVLQAEPGPGRTLPRPRERLVPDYPRSLKPLAIAGRVAVEVEVTSRGCARAAATTSSLDPMLDVETIRTVLRAPFDPMTVDGRPVASRVELTVTFKP